MIYGNASWGFREMDLEEQLKITAKMELPILELGIANAPKDLTLDASYSELENVKSLYKKYSVKLMCAATGNDFTNGKCDDVEKVEKVIDICAKLGVKYLRIFAGFSPAAEVVGERWDIMIDCLNEVSGYAKSKGVYAVVETHGGVTAFDDGVEHFVSVTTNIETLTKILKQAPDIKLNYDPANLYAAGIENQKKFFEKIKDRVCCVHLKDFVKLPSGHLRPAACGESDFDWKTTLSMLKDFGGPAMFEYEIPESVEEGCKKCLEYIKKTEETI